MPKHYIMHACGVRRGLAFSSNHLRHLIAQSSHAQEHTRHMLADGLHRMFHKHHSHRIEGRGAERRIEDSEREVGDGLKRIKRRPQALKFNF